jgi:hypothetical protein
VRPPVQDAQVQEQHQQDEREKARPEKRRHASPVVVRQVLAGIRPEP